MNVRWVSMRVIRPTLLFPFASKVVAVATPMTLGNQLKVR
jgi:hypothetical protein